MARAAVRFAALVCAFGPGLAATAVERPADVAVRVEVDLRVASGRPVRGVVRLEREGLPAEERTVALEPGTASRIDLPLGSVWSATVDAPGFWVRRWIFRVGAGTDQIERPEAWPLGVLTGRLTTAERPPRLPTQLVVTTLPVRKGSRNSGLPRGPRGEIECPVDRAGRFRCELPVAAYDLSLFVQSFVPSYAWDVTIPAQGEATLPPIALRRGASIAGWVESTTAALDPARCRITIAPAVAAAGGDQAAADKAMATARSVRIDERGFFQVVGVAPGTYSVAVEQGRATARGGPFVVVEREETYLAQPFLLAPPIDLDLEVSPPQDAQGRPWTVRLERYLDSAVNRSESVFDGPTAADGVVRVPRQRPGRFAIRVFDSRGQKFLTEPDIAIESVADRRRRLEIPLIEVEGRVRRGERPERATLWFGGRHGLVSIAIAADEDGRFSGAIPRAGDWRIDVESAGGSTLSIKRRVESRDGGARLDLDLPATRLYGYVLASSGRPEPGATVSILEADGSSQVLTTDEMGRFEQWGVAPGLASLAGEQPRGERESAQLDVEVPADGEVGPVEVRLSRGASWSGKVVSSRGVERGAGVTVVGTAPARFGIDRVRTGSNGAYAARLPPEVTRAVVVVGAVGSALTAFDVGRGAGAELIVGDSLGTLEIDLGVERARAIAEEGAWVVVFQNGLELPLQTLADWARSHGAPAPIGRLRRHSALAPGAYTACLLPIAARRDLARSVWPREEAFDCRSGVLASGEVLRLSLAPSVAEAGEDMPERR